MADSDDSSSVDFFYASQTAAGPSPPVLEIPRTQTAVSNVLSFTEQLLSDSLISQYEDLLSQQAQAAALLSVFGSESDAESSYAAGNLEFSPHTSHQYPASGTFSQVQHVSSQSVANTCSSSQSVTSTCQNPQSVTSTCGSSQSVASTCDNPQSVTSTCQIRQSVTSTCSSSQSVASTCQNPPSVTSTSRSSQSVASTSFQSGQNVIIDCHSQGQRTASSQDIKEVEDKMKSSRGKKKRRNASEREKTYKCTECDYSSRWPNALTNHTRTHNNTLFYCFHCDYSTAWKSDLNNHMRIHSGEMFQCKECDYKTYRKQSLLQHNQIHTGEKPYQCKECTYTCTSSWNLRSHSRVHSGELPVSCDLCTYRCRQRAQLKQHQRKHHENQEGDNYD